MNSHLINFVERLGLQESKSVFFRNKNYRNSPFFTTEIKFKIDLIKPDAYYTFNKQPLILFFDLTTANEQRELEIHKQVWSFDYAPLIFIIHSDRIETYNAFHYEKEVGRLKRLDVSQEEVESLFSFWKLETGQAWSWLQDNVYKKYQSGINKKRVNQRLFENIKEVRESLELSGHSTSDANTIILRLIFIRYLIDRGVVIPKAYISGDSVEECRKSFSQLIERPKDLSDFFTYLNHRFNGVLFKQRTAISITPKQAKYLSNIFDSRKEKDDNVLFEKFYFDIFDFSIIPVEVISGIYESIIAPETKNSDSAIFTPPFLVDYILSQTVDNAIQELHKNEKKVEFKIFDPACGSGIFLVQAYRRMVDEEIKRNNVLTLESKRLRQIAENTLFGIDVNIQSLLVASFSIYIALLDYKDPKAINNFKFPKLIGKNLFAANFFDTKHSFNKKFKESGKFDFILGNPPWKSKKGDPFHLNYIEKLSKGGFTTGRFEIAQTFLLRTKDFVSDNTRCALIVTSTIFYNISKTTKAFKKGFLNYFSLSSFFDLSAVRKVIFEAAISPASIVFYKKSLSKEEIDKNVVSHFSVKSNSFLKYFKTIVIEKYDRKEILQSHFLKYDWMFKVALYGNVLDFQFIKKVKNITQKISDLIDEKTIFKGDGVLKGSPKKHFNFLIGKPLLGLNEIEQYYTYVPEDAITLKKEDVFLESGRRMELFEGKHILINSKTKNESDIVVSYIDKPVVYEHNTYGISSDTREEILKLIYGYLISKLYTYYQFLQSSAWGIGTRPEVKLEEHFSFPYSELNEKDKSLLVRLVNDFLNPVVTYRKQFLKSENIPIPSETFEKINELINRAYEVSIIERDLIDYTLNVSRYQFQESKQHKFLRKLVPNDDVLKDYADVFINELSRIYDKENLTVEIYYLDSFIALNFKFLKENTISEKYSVCEDHTSESTVLAALSQNLTIWNITSSVDNSENLYIQKDIKGFENDSFYIIKPNEYKCWQRAIAWYDLAEVKEKIEESEVETLNTD